MATFEIYDELIEPLYQALREDTRFEGVNLIYDRMGDEPPISKMPLIQIFLETPWEDASRGSGSYTFQTRRLYVRIGIATFVCDSRSEADLDRHLFHIVGNLLDFIWEKRNWRTGVYVRGDQSISWDVAYGRTAQGGMVGAHRLSVQFEMFNG